MKLLTEYLERVELYENLAAQETDPTLKTKMQEQAKSYRRLAARRARDLGFLLLAIQKFQTETPLCDAAPRRRPSNSMERGEAIASLQRFQSGGMRSCRSKRRYFSTVQASCCAIPRKAGCGGMITPEWNRACMVSSGHGSALIGLRPKVCGFRFGARGSRLGMRHVFHALCQYFVRRY